MYTSRVGKLPDSGERILWKFQLCFHLVLFFIYPSFVASSTSALMLGRGVCSSGGNYDVTVDLFGV